MVSPARMAKTKRAPKGQSRPGRAAVGGGPAPRVVQRKGAALFGTFVAEAPPMSRKIETIRQGVFARVVDDMVKYLDVPKLVIFGLLHMPDSTAHKLIKDNRRLDSAASERVVRVADVTRMAQQTFGGREPAIRWLKTPNLALAGVTPLSLLDTEPGASEVRRIISSIDYGGVV